ncbi:hypothetical protein ACIA8O_27500 [Kitasatospora sp. NPDC051853]|uniref:hypothetical protein n=1 Tax=Kitasatospora sp. NPDC051853 TaxID=3364058 RepID=UPI0037AA93E9
MSTAVHPESGLSKSVWSDADFEEMGWHDATVHGLSVQQGEHVPRLLLDLDYIVRWVHPVRPAKSFSFWVAPATLVFEEVWEVQGGLDFTDLHLELELDEVHRLPPPDGREQWPLWHLQGHSFDLRFRAAGFRQYVRRAPQLSPGPAFSAAERGGCSFTELGFA